MRLMDHHDNPQNSSNNSTKRENSNHSSPVTTPSPPTRFIRINSIVRLTTMLDEHRTGKDIAFDPTSNLVTLHIRGSKANLTSVAMINLNHCREWAVEQETKEDSLDPLYPIDISKLKKRQSDNEMEKKREASFVNIKATRIGQALFRDLKKTMNQVIRWANNDILINNTVRIVEPYRAENVSIDSTPSNSANATQTKSSAKSDNDTKTHIVKLVEKFWSDQTKIASLEEFNSTTRSKSDSLSKTTAQNDSLPVA